MKKFVYFIADTSGRVRIGVSAEPRARLGALQTGTGDLLTLLGSIVGDYNDERAWHMQYASKCVVGEWFVLDNELAAAIGAACREVDVPAQNVALIARLRRLEEERFLINREIDDVYAELKGVDRGLIEVSLIEGRQACLESEKDFQAHMATISGGRA